MKVVHTDYELVERLQKGDVEAFDLIYDKYSGNLYAFGLKYLRLISNYQLNLKS